MPDDRTESPAITANLRAEIERLTALLHDAEARLGRTDTEPETPSAEQTMTILADSIVQALGRTGPSPESSSKRTAKIPDLPILTDGLDPTFESWKNQIQAKLSVNADYFASNTACIVYIFSCMSGNVQKHLNPRIREGTLNPFRTGTDIVTYLSGIYKDPFRTENAAQHCGEPGPQTQYRHHARRALYQGIPTGATNAVRKVTMQRNVRLH